jgi:hypothetical protein
MVNLDCKKELEEVKPVDIEEIEKVLDLHKPECWMSCDKIIFFQTKIT